MQDKNINSATAGAEGSPAIIPLNRFEEYFLQVLVDWTLAEISFRIGLVGSSFSEKLLKESLLELLWSFLIFRRFFSGMTSAGCRSAFEPGVRGESCRHPGALRISYCNTHVCNKYKKTKAVQRYGNNAIACCNLKTEAVKRL